ncbi:hypothetical protein BAJUN_01480 [Bajunvirus bajun]|uniref:Uncharacterized protein n=1 Tax=Brevundimonas phage vB_BgoS-Bajun TaxID=2948594 RepID=A0A9E7SRL9_9CAUD|nr:hypothetical protein BAJUN_01480 [Brevundimonas phage vB_BgoS-Bajun]
MADENYDRKIEDAPVSLFKEKGALEVDYQRGHVSPPDGGPDIPPSLTIALKDGKDWFEVSFDSMDMSRVARDLGVSLLKTFDPSLLALLPIDGEVTEEKLEIEIDDLPARATKKDIELVISQILDFAGDDVFVEERLLEALKKKLKTTGALIKAAVKGVRDSTAPAVITQIAAASGGQSRRPAPPAEEYEPAPTLTYDEEARQSEETAHLDSLRQEVEDATRTGRAGEFVEEDRPTLRDSREYDDRDRAYDAGDDRR